jgi:hypothetical protein
MILTGEVRDNLDSKSPFIAIVSDENGTYSLSRAFVSFDRRHRSSRSLVLNWRR